MQNLEQNKLPFIFITKTTQQLLYGIFDSEWRKGAHDVLQRRLLLLCTRFWIEILVQKSFTPPLLDTKLPRDGIFTDNFSKFSNSFSKKMWKNTENTENNRLIEGMIYRYFKIQCVNNDSILPKS